MKIQIDKTELDELRRKAQLYDEIISKSAAASKKGWAKLSKAEKSTRAKKAVQARIDKNKKNC